MLSQFCDHAAVSHPAPACHFRFQLLQLVVHAVFKTQFCFFPLLSTTRCSPVQSNCFSIHVYFLVSFLFLSCVKEVGRSIQGKGETEKQKSRMKK